MRIERVGRCPVVPGWAVLVVGGYLLLVGLHEWLSRTGGLTTGPLCLFRRITDQPCPGCGSTRLVLAILRGRLGEAIGCNPLMFTLAVLGLALLAVRLGLGRRLVWITSPGSARLLAIALILLVLANWAYLLAMAEGSSP